MATHKGNQEVSEKKPLAPTTEQLLARAYPIYSERPIHVEPKATDLCRVRPRRWINQNGKTKKLKKANAPN